MSEQIEALKRFGQEHLGLPSEAPLPRILLPGGSIKIRDTAHALYSQIGSKMGLFYRGGTIVKPETNAEDSQLILKVLKPAAARSEFEKYADFVIRRNDELTRNNMSEDIARAMIESDVGQAVLPNVKGLLNGPLLILHQGSLHMLQPGYDHRTGYYVTGQPVIEPANLADAVNMVESVIMDFTFQTDSDISRAVAALLTPALKFGGFIRGTIPIEIIEASDTQTGKGFLTLRRAAIYGEKPVLVSQQKGGVGSFDEKFSSSLVKGRPFITLDNYRGILDSAHIEAFLTSDGMFSVRTPGCPESYVDLAKFAVAITSNGLQTTPDLANRATFIRLIKEDNPEFVEINGMRMLETIRANQPRFLGAVCKVIRHWYERGMPKTNERRHSFSAWAQTLDWIVQDIFELAPLLDGNSEAQERIQNPHLTFLRLLANQVAKKKQLGQPLSATAIFELCEEANIQVPGIKRGQTYEHIYERQAVGKVMTQIFKRDTTFTFEGIRVERAERDVITEAGNSMSSKCYTFSRSAGGEEAAIELQPPAA